MRDVYGPLSGYPVVHNGFNAMSRNSRLLFDV